MHWLYLFVIPFAIFAIWLGMRIEKLLAADEVQQKNYDVNRQW